MDSFRSKINKILNFLTSFARPIGQTLDSLFTIFTIKGATMLLLERIPDQIGYLVLKEDGAVLTSGGELENDERIANIIVGLVTLTNKIDPKGFPSNEAFDKISITYPDHCYVICLSNKKIHVVKKKLVSATTAVVEQLPVDL